MTPAVGVRPTRRAEQRSLPSARGSAPWTVRLWQSRPDLVRLRTVDGVAVVRVSGDRRGRSADGPRQQRPGDGYCEVNLLPHGRVTVACDCAPPVVHLPSSRGAQPQPLPTLGAGRCTAAIGPEETLLLMSSAVAENGPALVRHLLDEYLPESGPEHEVPGSHGSRPLDELFRQLTQDHPHDDLAVVVLRRTGTAVHGVRVTSGDVAEPAG